MFATLVLTILLFPLPYLYGRMIVALFNRSYRCDALHNLPFMGLMLTGLSGITAIIAYTSLLWPVYPIGLVFLSIGAVLSIVTLRRQLWPLPVPSQPTRLLMVLALVLVGFCLLYDFGSSTIHGSDVGLYHLQAIAWIRQYAVVPGLANLNHRLGFNSLWYMPNAILHFPFGLHHGVYPLNFVIAIAACITALAGWHRWLAPSDHPPRMRDLFQALLLIPLFNLCYMPMTAAPSNDLPAALLVLTLAILAMEYRDREQQHQSTCSLVPLMGLLTGFAIGVKLSSLPISLILAYALLQEWRQRQFKVVALALALAALMVLPFVLRNLVLSGYVIYPYPGLNWFNLEWRVPDEIVLEAKKLIVSWARWPFGDPDQAYYGGWSVWFPEWIRTFSQSQTFRYGMAAIGLTIVTLFTPRSDWRKGLGHYGIVHLSLFAGVVFWLISAPDLRFAYGFVWGWITLLVANGLWPLLTDWQAKRRRVPRWVYGLCAFYLALGLGAIGYASLRHWQLVRGQDFALLPVAFPAVETRPVNLGNQVIHISVNDDKCWLQAFPCTGEYRSGLMLRGSSLQNGFRITATTIGDN